MNNYQNINLIFTIIFTKCKPKQVKYEIWYYIYFLNEVPKLQTFKIPYQCSESKYLKTFLEIDGKNLVKIYICDDDSTKLISYNMSDLNDLNLSIAIFVQILKNLLYEWLIMIKY